MCHKREPPSKPIRRAMTHYNVGASLKKTALDIIGRLSKTQQGHKNILITVYFAKWTEAYSMVNQETHTNCRFLD